MRAGTLKTAIELWERTNTTNGMGDSVGVWAKKYTVQSYLRPTKAREYMQAEQLTNSIDATFIVRYNSAIRSADTGNMVIHEPNTEEWFDIIAPIQPDYARKTLTIIGKLREQPPQDLTLEYSVTYNSNTGTGTAPVDSNTYYVGETVTVLDNEGLTKDGFNFDGWNTQADGKGTKYDADDTFTMPNANVTLYALWAD